ncbi:hypothetical protein NM208_g9420 [Fusarium decemcellulare]|uniref:Uncharacterized protein n=1 Tax=Fusarium decemcellulare TaxID=57161 RepID=A0ACC1S1Y2_9HYPO|nr:hypothetical protein NM208_g9420 [Fusarium decemcellulare]
MTANKPVDDAIIIGIDFGTTFSGVAWAYSREPDAIELVTSWDSELNHCSDVEKAPTQLYYGNDGKEVLWGYSIPTDKDALKWFKLLLLDEKDLPDGISASTQIREARRLQREINKDPIDIIGCFLRKIWNHAIESIKRTVSAELLQKSIFHVVITLPAIWPPYAQHRMKQAAKISGILDARSCGATTLRFISEPEAAALATMKDLSKRSTIKSGDTIVICDAGGGTVDLISYIVESTEPFVVKECVKGEGDLCGGVFLDENFVNLIKTKLPSGSWNLVSKTEEKKFLNDGWEHGIKPQFENQAKIWPVDLPDSCSSNQFKGLKRRMTLDLTSCEILSVFLPIVSKIEALVTRQVDAIKKMYREPPKYIILVGGFGRSRYLFSSLQDKYGSTVLQSRGTKPWTAICRGAVVQGLTSHHLSPSIGVNVKARIARMSYGIKYTTRFDPKVHDIRDRHWSEDEQEFQAKNQMKWFLREASPIGRVSNTIYSSFTFPPPSRFDYSVSPMCEVKWSQHINFESLPTWTNPIGKVFHKLQHDIEMTCEDGIVDFTVYHDGARVGGHNVEVEFN